MPYDRGGQAHLEAIVDLQNLNQFEEHFYLVVMEKLQNGGGSVLHMWRMVISSESEFASIPPSLLTHSLHSSDLIQTD